MAYQSESPFDPESGPWTERVTFSPRGFAFVPNQVLVSGETARDRAVRLITEQTDKEPRVTRIFEDEWLVESDAPFDVEFVVAELRHLGLAVEPNHVLFTHSGGCGCGAPCGCPCGACSAGSVGAGHTANPFTATPFTATPFTATPFTATPFTATPFTATPFTATPFTATPFTATPFTATPFTATPFTATPFTATPFTATGARASSARPAAKPDPVSAPALTEDAIRVVIMDSGLARNDQLPDLLKIRPLHDATAAADRDEPDESRDDYLDPVSGHGTFIAGIVEQLAPKQRVQCVDVVTTFGDTNAALVANRLFRLLADGDIDKTTIINMSFGGYTDDRMALLALAIRRVQATGAVVVASAGNDSSCRPTFPAVLPGVVSVGSVEPHGRAHYSNFGPWVRACAPGTELTSTFYNDYDGNFDPVPNGPDPDKFIGWAHWTGTSFAAPVVVAALVRHAILHATSLKEAVVAVVDSPSLARSPGLGTIVNLAPGL